MAKKIYIDNRVTTNGKKSNIEQDNSLDLNNHIKTIITESGASATFDPTISGLTSTTVKDAIDEIATEWTEATVVIPTAQILVSKDSPIDILGSGGTGKYYVIDEVQFKYTKGEQDFTIVGVTDLQLTQNNVAIASIDPALISNGNAVAVVNGMVPAGGIAPRIPTGGKIRLASIGSNPAIGTGSSLTVIIKYKIVTF